MKVLKDNITTINLETGQDLTGASVYIMWSAPDGSTGEWVANKTSSPTDGIITLDKAFDQTGTWKLWAKTIGLETYLGDTVLVEVFPVPAEESGITDVATVKKWLGLDSAEWDFHIKKLIPVVEEDYRRIRGVDWDREITTFGDTWIYGDIIYPEGSDVVAAEMIGWKLFGRSAEDGYRDITRESLGSYSVSYSDSADYPKSITSSINKYVGFLL